MADPVAKALEDINRTLKDISTGQKEQTRILKTIAENYIAVHKDPDEKLLPPLSADEVKQSLYIPRTYGWSAAALHQREGTLKHGDRKRESDESLWVWTVDNAWERVEEPSANGETTG